MQTILFQGDSITDARRNREDDNYSGNGYANMVKGVLGARRPGVYQFYNRGVSGNHIVDIYARGKVDIINLRPDYMSILVGVNDVWHGLSRCNGTSTAKFEMLYDMLIDEVVEALPSVKIMILEPFVERGSVVENFADYPPDDAWERMRDGVREKAEASRRVAEKHGLAFIPLQHIFDEAVRKAPVSYWLFDGVHPTAMGHALIMDQWLAAFEQLENA